MTSISAKGVGKVSASLRADGSKFAAKEEQLVRKYAQLLKTRIQGNASGRPGPNAPTGDYRRSWGIQHLNPASGPASLVGTNAPQGYRLELGFTGVDSLGREYDQPPYPHVGPAVDSIEPEFLREYERNIPK